VELAKPICVHFIGGKTDVLKPKKRAFGCKNHPKMPGDTVLRLYLSTDRQQGKFLCLARRRIGPASHYGNLARRLVAQKSDATSAVGGGCHCYFNILGDHLRQGYHQYIFADKIYPEGENQSK
jgi:hypothetical protein